MTMVRMKVAKSDPMFATPILAKIAVRAANAADSRAQTCQVSRKDFIASSLGFGASRTIEAGPGHKPQRLSPEDRRTLEAGRGATLEDPAYAGHGPGFNAWARRL